MIQKNQETSRLPLTNDYVFKRIFAKEGNEDILKDLLEAILNISIKKVEVKNPELPKNMADEKLGVLDIKVYIDDKIVVDVEMQMGNKHNIEHRSTRYMTKLSSDQLKTSEEYTELKKVIVINILNFKYYKRNSYHSVAHMKFEKTKDKEYVDLGYEKEDEIVTDVLEMHFIELPKFRIKNPGVATKLEQWLWILVGEGEKIEMAKKENKEIERAVEELDEMSLDEKERELYEARQRAIFEYNYDIYKAEERGKKEVAKEMILRGISIEDVQESTKLEKEEIEKIIENLDEKERELYETRQRAIFEYEYVMYEAEERGKKEGVQQGKRDNQIEIAKKLLIKGMKTDEIQEITGLAKEEIITIKENYDKNCL